MDPITASRPPRTGAESRGPDEVAGIHEGRDGWLFLVGGTNAVLDQFKASLRNGWTQLRWRFRIGRRAARSRRLGIRFWQLIVPEKLSVYGDRYADFDLAGSPARRLGDAMAGARYGSSWIDLVRPFRAAPPMPALYLRTDTHWSIDGCHLAYREICRAVGASPIDLALRAAHDIAFSGDLGSKLVPPRIETVTIRAVAEGGRRSFASPLVRAFEAADRVGELHTGAHVIFENAGAATDPRRLVIFGDSCAHFGQGSLTGLLAETFRETHFVWSASLDWTYVEDARPDILLCVLAERFMARVPSDRFDLPRAAAARLARSGLAVPSNADEGAVQTAHCPRRDSP